MISALEPCECRTAYSLEKQEDGSFILFLGRCPHKHGYNLAYIKEPAWNFNPNFIVKALNDSI